MNNQDIKEFSEEYFDYWKNNCNMEKDEKCKLLIEQADRCFSCALEETKSDMIWNGYIKYNKVRADVMSYLLMNPSEKKKQYEDIKKSLDECVNARNKICIMLTKRNDESCQAEITNEKLGYLEIKFKEEKDRAENLRKDFIKVFSDID